MNAATLVKRAVMAGVGLILAGGISLGVLTLPAHADDDIMLLTSENQNYRFNFSYFGDSQHTDPVSKDNATASWILVDDMTIYDVHHSWGTYNSLN